ncbi:MAG: response regulator [Bacteroidetes bacterium]|nr:response regulator [Bacteroidota bacterium]
MTQIKLLLVEDNDTDALLVVRQLKKEGLDIDHVQVKTRDEMEQAFASDTWDLVISDYSLPGFGGKDALDLFNSKNLDIPFILVSGTVGEDIAVTIMKGGANDYLMKTHLHRLGPAVKRELEETQVKREKKRIESVLTQTEKRFQSLIEDLRDLVFLSSMDGKKIYIVNPAFEAIYGQPLKALEENPMLWQDVIHEDDKSLLGPMAEELKLTGVCEGEYRIVRPDQSIRWVYDRRCKVFTDEEEEPLMGGIVIDVTEKKQAEEELHLAKSEAEKSSRMKSALMQNMSHEFRTPMNGILGFSEILFEELEDEKTRTKAEYVLSSGKRLQQTLDSIMLLAQLESDISLNPEEINLASMLQEIASPMKEQAIEKGLDLTLSVEDELTLISDSSLLQRILTDILDNAVKFTNSGEVTINTCVTGSNRDQIEIRICDTGIGIPDEKLSLIFEEFRQAEEGYDRPYEGSGLGLSIASKCIKILGGILNVESEPGKGSTFILSFPVNWKAEEPGEKAVVSPKPVEPRPKEKPTVTEPFLLLVEDNDANIELIKLFLTKEYQLDVANDGESSLEMVKKKQYDCILMDINLGPGMDGIDAITEIRKMPSYQATPIVAVTGYTFRNEKEFIIAKGANHYIEKPFTRELLIGVLSKVLRN